jgi:hypothetical protein
LLPGGLYPAALKALGVQSNGIKTMEEIRSTGISIERFLRICSKSDFNIAGKKFYLFNPIYEYKFGIKPRTQLGVVGAIPFLRNFVTMGVYYLTESRN